MNCEAPAQSNFTTSSWTIFRKNGVLCFESAGGIRLKNRFKHNGPRMDTIMIQTSPKPYASDREEKRLSKEEYSGIESGEIESGEIESGAEPITFYEQTFDLGGEA